MSYNPEIHHRRSIRMKGHDYSGGGVYFVTICAHREFVEWAKGVPFGEARMPEGTARMPEGTARMPPVREVMEDEMQKTARLLPWMEWGEWVIMPDHFHAIIRIDGGHGSLGDVITGFKAGVTRALRVRGDILVAQNGTRASEKMRIWQRNYYEMIVRDAKAEANITNYIRTNPWRCVMDFGNGLRGMGNPAIWEVKKLGVLCSRNAPRPKSIPKAEVYFSGFHSPMEKEIFEKLLKCKRPVIWCPAWGLEGPLSPAMLEAFKQNRMLMLEMKNRDGNLAAAEQRNRFVLECADELWLPYVTKGGMLDRLIQELSRNKEFKLKIPVGRE